jgi:hypothetical protein
MEAAFANVQLTELILMSSFCHHGDEYPGSIRTSAESAGYLLRPQEQRSTS